MARSSLADIIAEAKSLLGNDSWFTDDQIQSELDRSRLEHQQTSVASVYQLDSNGQRVYKIWTAPTYLDTDIVFQDSDYATVTPDTTDLINGRIAFNADQENYILRLTGFEYDIYSAAAELLDKRAAAVVDKVTSFTGPPGSFSRPKTESEALRDMANRYRKKAKANGLNVSMRTIDLDRGDHY